MYIYMQFGTYDWDVKDKRLKLRCYVTYFVTVHYLQPY